MKRRLITTIVLLLAIVLAAPWTALMEAEEVNISFSGRFDPAGAEPESAYFLKKIEEFNQLDNGINVSIVWNSVESDYLNRLATDIASNACPNVFMEYGGSRVLDYLEAGILYNLQDEYDKDPDWFNSIYPNMLSPVVFTNYGYEGIYGTPFGAYEVCLVYNEAHLNACGLEAPKTWADVMEASKILKENGYQPFMVGERDTYRFGHLFSNLAITAYGEEAIKIGTRETGYDSDEAKEIYALMIDAYNQGYLGENILSFGASEERAYMGEGKSTFMWDLTSRIYWLDGTAQEQAKNLHIVNFPAVNEEYIGWSQGGASQAFYISTQNASEEQIAASVEFLKYITGGEFLSGLAAETNSTYAIAFPSESTGERSYLYSEVDAVMADTNGIVIELQNYDTEAGALNIVRNALQTIVQGATVDDISNTIVDGFEDLL